MVVVTMRGRGTIKRNEKEKKRRRRRGRRRRRRRRKGPLEKRLGGSRGRLYIPSGSFRDGRKSDADRLLIWWWLGSELEGMNWFRDFPPSGTIYKIRSCLEFVKLSRAMGRTVISVRQRSSPFTLAWACSLSSWKQMGRQCYQQVAKKERKYGS